MVNKAASGAAILTPSQNTANPEAPEGGAFARLAAWAVGLGLLAVGVRLFLAPPEWASLFPRDLKVYQAAMDAIAAGLDPYPGGQGHPIHGLVFTSPPFVLWLFKLIAQAGLETLFRDRYLLALDAISVLVIPVAVMSRPASSAPAWRARCWRWASSSQPSTARASSPPW